MKKKSILLLLLISSHFLVFSQDIKKLTVAVPGFQVSQDSDIPQQTVTAIEQQVVDVFVNNKKFTVLERSQLGILKNEIDLQKQESFIDGKGNLSDQVKNTGANYLLTGVVSSMNFYSEEKEEKKMNDKFQMITVGRYTAIFCTITFNLKLIDITTGQILNSKVINVKNSTSRSGTSGGGLLGTLTSSGREGAEDQTSAYNDAIGSIQLYVRSFVKESFPNILQIAEISEKDRSGNAKSILLIGDFVDYISEGQKLYVKLITETEVAGRKLIRKKNIGEVKVIKIEDGGFINVKVRNGEKEITEAFENKNKLEITEVE